ncbi:hypothetical protein CFD26_108889 [Aspergillus turcosus]|uniref:Tyrosine specific protein phosphatases domain-containing protein n=1 Tax=Aspergillus turcosus TaxID=1245748 RepID=A0A421DIW9_9EURO|nr:hypothetical protein CFD26_108889 [Aspergillus turcosus]
MGSITASPAAADLKLADVIDVGIDQPIPSEALTRILSKPPFLIVEGGFNIRDSGHIGHPGIQPGLIYRSGLLANLTEIGAPAPIIPSNFAAKNGNDAYRDMYLDILESHVPSFSGLLTYVRDELNARSGGENRAVPFHCHAGKDRTGVASALLLSLGGVLDKLIARDYALTRVGIETEKEYLLRSLQQAWPECAAGAAGFKEFADTKASYMMTFLEAVKVKYGGMEKFVVDVIGMSKADIEALRGVLRGES